MSWRVTAGPGIGTGPPTAIPFTKAASWGPAIPFNEVVELAVDLAPRRHGLVGHERRGAVQGQDQLVADGEGAREELADRLEAAEVQGADCVEDLAEQAVGAVLERVQQGLAVGVAAVERPDTHPGRGRSP